MFLSVDVKAGLIWHGIIITMIFFPIQLPVKKKTKAVTKKMKKILEFEKRLQEKELVMEFYREFWPDNV